MTTARQFVNALSVNHNRSIELSKEFRALATQFEAIAAALESGEINVDFDTTATRKSNDVRALLVRFNCLRKEIGSLCYERFLTKDKT